ncbi:MAG: oligoendopeptidase F [Candidatus Izemoplasmatales bacterium]|nr:oligoendopeptidase F [bacterium]MDZ4196222.1 oligoendopeptidase F [Candidatus Izemoplasmatales bacterium]
MNWDLTYLFPSIEDFEQSYHKTIEIIKKLGSYKGRLSDEASFVEYYTLQKEIQVIGLPVYQYASLLSDLNKKNQDNAAILQKVHIAFATLSQAVSFEEPELIILGKEKVLNFVNNHIELAEYKFGFEKLFRRQEHILDDQSEALLSNFNQIRLSGKDLYSSLSVADIEHGDVMLENGEIVTITDSNYRAYIQKSESAEERKEIFESVFSYYETHKNTYASIYKTVLEADLATMKSRKYTSCLESYLFNNQIPVDVYFSLTTVARQNTSSIKKYLQIRKDFLGLDEIHTYDRFLDLVKTNKEYEFEDAKQLFFASIKHFPVDFQEKAFEVLRDGFVDVYEAEGKRTGAYSSSMPNLHPFILLNYSKTLGDVFTVAHEAGHSMHSMYAAQAQPANLQNYTIFVAEVASTFNEHNLLDYIIKESDASKDEKIALLQRAIDDILSTFYRQTLFAIFELEAHKLVENKQPITADALSKIMIGLYEEFYGIDIRKEDMKQYVWAYVPHFFYTPFYVYQYATSFAASLKIYENVKANKDGAFEGYINLLKSGGSDYPIEQLKRAGVDLTTKDAFFAVANRLEELVNQLEIEIQIQ